MIGHVDLLIQQGLLAKLRWSVGECLINLKDLLTAFPPSLKGILQNEPILGGLFLCRIAPNSAIFRQNLAEYGITSTFLAIGFIRTARCCGSGAIPMSAAHKLAGRPKASQGRAPGQVADDTPHSCLQRVTGFHQRVAG